jgi:hypothetical protein
VCCCYFGEAQNVVLCRVALEVLALLPHLRSERRRAGVRRQKMDRTQSSLWRLWTLMLVGPAAF